MEERITSNNNKNQRKTLFFLEMTFSEEFKTWTEENEGLEHFCS
jgi:hypothetical protein